MIMIRTKKKITEKDEENEKPVETRQTNEKEDVIKKLRRKSVRVVERPVSEEVANPNNKRPLEFMDNPGATKRRTGFRR